MLNDFNRSVLLMIFIVFFHNAGKGQTLHYSNLDSLPLDTGIRYGKLSNGFTYYIKRLEKPQQKIEMFLYVKAGTNQQRKGDLDIAHTLEHIAFMPTKNFPKSIREVENKYNMTIYDVLGYSGAFTEYIFYPPAHSREAMHTGLHWFQDIAQNLKFTEVNVENARGELRQEFLGKNGADMEAKALKTKMNAYLFPGGEDRTEYLKYNKEFSAEIISQFYNDWYRPGLMAVSIVGNIENVDGLEKKIRKIFSQLKSEKNTPDFEADFDQYIKRPTQFVKLERKSNASKGFNDELVETHLFFRTKNTPIKNNSWKELKEERIWQIFTSVLRDRLKNKVRRYNTSYSSSVRLPFKNTQYPGLPVLIIDILSRDNFEVEALRETMAAIYQIKEFGITKEEWEKYRKTKHSDIENSSYWTSQIKKHFFYREALPENKNVLLNNWIENITLAAFNKQLSDIISVSPEDIALIAPKGHQALTYTEPQIRNWISSITPDSFAPYQPPKRRVNLNDQGKIGSLKKRKIIDEQIGVSGAKKYTLENGLKVVLKSFKPSSESKEIMIKGFSTKGASCFSDENFYSAINAPEIIKNSGFGTMDKFEIDSFISKTGLFSGPVSYVDYNETVVQGTSSMEDLEVFLQLIYLYFSNPRKDKLAFDDWQKTKYQNYFKPAFNNMIFEDFSNKIRDITGDPTVAGEGIFGFKYLHGTKDFKGMQKTNFNKAFEIYTKLFGNARDFTFLISGDFKEKSVLLLLQKYLGGLPNKENFSCETEPVIEFDLPDENPLLEITPPLERYSMEGVYYYLGYLPEVDHPKDWKQHIKVEALGWYIYQELFKLRFEKGYSLYTVGSDGIYNNLLNRYEIFIKLLVKKDELALLREECEQIIANIKSGMIDDSTFSSSKPRLYNLYSAGRARSGREMQNRLFNHYRYGQAWTEPKKVEDFVKSITKDDLIETAKKYYQEENKLEAVMME